jgi:hypothetical protein
MMRALVTFGLLVQVGDPGLGQFVADDGVHRGLLCFGRWWSVPGRSRRGVWHDDRRSRRVADGGGCQAARDRDEDQRGCYC